MSSIGSSSGSFTTTFLNEAPPIVQQDGNDTILNLPLTIPETMFLAFIRNIVQRQLEQNCNLIYLGTSKEMQDSFSGWVAKTFESNGLSSEELNLVSIISTIWEKTKLYSENILKTSHNQELINDEKKWQEQADKTIQDFSSQGRSGKVFTLRQIYCLLTVADNIGK